MLPNQVLKPTVPASGGAAFVPSLIKADLIDEYHLIVNPTALGKGLTIFGELVQKLHQRLDDATPYECGVTVLRYSKV